MLALERVANVNVQVARVLRVGLARKRAGQLLALVDGDDVRKIKHRLLPVSVARAGAGREEHGLVRARKLNVKVRHDGVDVVVARGNDLERRREGKVLLLHSVEVERLDREREKESL